MKRMKLVGFCCALSLLCLIMAGCPGGTGVDMGAVTGTVTLDGAPLADATVEFQPNMETGGSPSYGSTDAAGEYELMFTFDKKGAMLGSHTVRISKTKEVPDPEDPEEMMEEETLSAEFNAETTLSATVEGGSQVINFDLVSAGDAPAAE